jgi:hypothetical protein
MSTTIVTKTKVSIGAIEPSELTIAFDINIPGGTTARAEVTADEGYIQPELFVLTTDPEVQVEVYVLLDGSEKRLLSLDEDSSSDVDVTEAYGELLTKKLIMIGKTKTLTTALRKITLNYTGGIYDYR